MAGSKEDRYSQSNRTGSFAKNFNLSRTLPHPRRDISSIIRARQEEKSSGDNVGYSLELLFLFWREIEIWKGTRILMIDKEL